MKYCKKRIQKEKKVNGLLIRKNFFLIFQIDSKEYTKKINI
jgi:hypothetical protein